MTLTITTAEAAGIIRKYYNLPPEVEVEFKHVVLTVDRAVRIIGQEIFDGIGSMRPEMKIALVKRIRELTRAPLTDAKFASEAWDSEVVGRFSGRGEIDIKAINNDTLAALLSVVKEQLGVAKN